MSGVVSNLLLISFVVFLFNSTSVRSFGVPLNSPSTLIIHASVPSITTQYYPVTLFSIIILHRHHVRKPTHESPIENERVKVLCAPDYRMWYPWILRGNHLQDVSAQHVRQYIFH